MGLKCSVSQPLGRIPDPELEKGPGDTTGLYPEKIWYHCCFFDQISGAARTRNLVEIISWDVFKIILDVFCDFSS